MDLSRFREAHERDYNTALAEIRAGQKRSHWMWYIFPQIRGLGRSYTAQFYSIQNIEEAKAFLNDTYLSGNIAEISQALLENDSRNAVYIFGEIDAMKLKSSMTLFCCVAGEESVFKKVLDKFFDGEMDRLTLGLIGG